MQLIYVSRHAKSTFAGHAHNYYNWLSQIKIFPILNTTPQTFTKGRTHIPQWCPQQCSTFCVSGHVQVQEVYKVFLSTTSCNNTLGWYILCPLLTMFSMLWVLLEELSILQNNSKNPELEGSFDSEKYFKNQNRRL